MPSMISPRQVESSLRAAGFVDICVRDLTVQVLATAALVMRRSYEPLRLAREHPRQPLHSPFPAEEANFRGHYEAAVAYAMGLHTGLFEHVWYQARRPRTESAAARNPGA